MSASSAALPWADTRGYLGALDTLLSTAPDTDALAAWRSAKAELLGLLGGSSASARRLLAELQASLARAEAGATDAALPLEELRLRLEQVEARKGALAERVARMAAERDASAAAMQRLLQATLELREEQKRLDAMRTSASPHLQCVCGGAPGCDVPPGSALAPTVTRRFRARTRALFPNRPPAGTSSRFIST